MEQLSSSAGSVVRCCRRAITVPDLACWWQQQRPEVVHPQDHTPTELSRVKRAEDGDPEANLELLQELLREMRQHHQWLSDANTGLRLEKEQDKEQMFHEGQWLQENLAQQERLQTQLIQAQQQLEALQIAHSADSIQRTSADRHDMRMGIHSPSADLQGMRMGIHSPSADLQGMHMSIHSPSGTTAADRHDTLASEQMRDRALAGGLPTHQYLSCCMHSLHSYLLHSYLHLSDHHLKTHSKTLVLGQKPAAICIQEHALRICIEECA